jgi:GNAT superfamily N-acetyltransferase
MSTLTVRAIQNATEFDQFFRFPWSLYQGDPNWVPPLVSMRRDLLDKAKNPAWQFMQGEYFGAWRGNQLVGTIAAFINHHHDTYQGERMGWFGQFECREDVEAARALLDSAAAWVHERGAVALRGPQNFTPHDEIGVLVENFTRPVALMPYNPPYYDRLITQSGLEKAMDVLSYYMDREMVAELGILPRLEKFISRLNRTLNWKLVPVTAQNVKQAFDLFQKLYNEAWAKNWGFSPMTDAERHQLEEGLGLFLDLSVMWMVEVDGHPVGIMLPIPDLNQMLHKANPRPDHPEWFTIAKAMWYWKVQPQITGVRVALFGITDEVRRKGVPVLLLKAALENWLKNPRYQYVDYGWVLETNSDIINVLELFGLRRYKRYRLYQRDLSAPST